MGKTPWESLWGGAWRRLLIGQPARQQPWRLPGCCQPKEAEGRSPGLPVLGSSRRWRRWVTAVVTDCTTSQPTSLRLHLFYFYPCCSFWQSIPPCHRRSSILQRRRRRRRLTHTHICHSQLFINFFFLFCNVFIKNWWKNENFCKNRGTLSTNFADVGLSRTFRGEAPSNKFKYTKLLKMYLFLEKPVSLFMRYPIATQENFKNVFFKLKILKLER